MKRPVQWLAVAVLFGPVAAAHGQTADTSRNGPVQEERPYIVLLPPTTQPSLATTLPGHCTPVPQAAVVAPNGEYRLINAEQPAAAVGLPAGEFAAFTNSAARDAQAPASDPDAYPIDLPTAIHLAGSQSLAVALAREQWREAQGRQMAAEALWLPSIRAGLNYNKHEGVIQDVVGNAFNTSRGAFYSGLGAGAVGAGSPAYPGIVAQFHLADALVQPLAARQTANSRSRATTAAQNDALLEAALAYVDLLSQAQQSAVAAEAADHAKQLGDLTAMFARNGEGTLADADRAATEVGLRDVDRARADEAYYVARARLAQVLRLEPTLKLTPIEEQVVPLELVDVSLPASELVAQGLSARPELAEQRHLTAAAVERLRRERLAPLVPSLLIGTSYGGFGAGLGGDIDDYGDRLDFDAVAYWELRNLGAGEQAARCTAQAQVNQARVRHTAMMDLVAREIVEAHARVEARRRQIQSAREATAVAESSYRRNVERIHGGVGLPLEALQSIQALATTRREYVRAVSDYNAAQFQLQRAMGYPVDGAAH